MHEHFFLCGLTAEQQAEFPSGTVLSHRAKTGKLKLELERLRKHLVGHEPVRLTDFIEIASFVFAADRLVSRGALTDPGFGAGWRRKFRLVIAVRDLAFWNRADVQEALTEVLGFLSEDFWRFDFVTNLEPIPLQEFLPGIVSRESVDTGGTSVVLFSGGLDSLAGAVHELRNTNRYVVLVSHLNLPGIGRRQKQIAQELIERFPGRVCHVWINNSLSRMKAREETQRTRSFFFTAMGAVAAHIETAERIRFFENGVMSVNLPLATQVVGARSSRSTHPRSLQLLNDFVELLARHPLQIDNPFFLKTKIEIVKELAATPEAHLITNSISCTRSRTANRTYQPHCGTCAQCLHRRISTLAGGAATLDEPQGYETDFLNGPREAGRDRVMAIETISLALECADISERDFFARFSGVLPWVWQAYPADQREGTAKEVLDLFRRHGQAVRQLLLHAADKQLPEVIDQTLSPNSLLALTLKNRLFDLPGVIVDGIEEPAIEPSAEPDVSPPSVDEIQIAIDEKQKRILIRNLPELKGSAIFPIVKLLIEISLEDRSKPGLPERYNCLRGREIADRLPSSDEVSIRAAITRARAELKKAFNMLGWSGDSSQALIETTTQGYRLNPEVRIVERRDIDRD